MQHQLPSSERALESLERQLKTTGNAKSSESTFALLADALSRLRRIPVSVDPQRRIACLIEIGSQYFNQGEDYFAGLEVSALALAHARDLADPFLVRRTLNLHAILLLHTYNLGTAVASLTEALEIAERIGDKVGEVAVWNNFGNAFYQAALYDDAMECWKHASSLPPPSSDLLPLKVIALSNVGLCCLHRHDYLAGVDVMHEAMALARPADDAKEGIIMPRVFAHGTHTRLLLALDRLGDARDAAAKATGLAARTNSVPAWISAACSAGLVEVYSGLTDEGLSRLSAALDKARSIKPSFRETILAVVQGHERAGSLERALELQRELTLHVLKVQMESLDRHDVKGHRDPEHMVSKDTVARARRRLAAVTQSYAEK